MSSYIKKLLLSDEHIIYTTYRHPIIFVPAIGWFLLSLIAFNLNKFIHTDHLTSQTQNLYNQFVVHFIFWGGGLLCLLLGIIALLSAWIALFTSEYALTNKRVIVKTGWIRHKSLDILLKKVESVMVSQGICGRLFDYGTIIICGTGGSKDPLYRIRHPMKFRNRVQEQAEQINEK